MKTSLVVLAAALACGAADLPDAYRTVSQIVFVVPNAAQAAAAWRKAGVPVSPARPLDGVYGRRATMASFANVTAMLVEPGSRGPLHEFLVKQHGGGFALVHRFSDEPALAAELGRLKALGVQPLFDVQWNGAHYVFLDTIAAGKYSLALSSAPRVESGAGSRRVVQYAFVAHDLEAVSAFWNKLGFPAMTYSHPDTSELIYRGKPGAFDMRLGWQRHADVPYEWIQPLKGPSTYYDHVKQHGESFHHLAFNVDDMDAGIAEWSGFGFPMVMGGAWGAKGKPGSGRFAYHDLDGCCGHEIELLWNYRAR
jgi:methylmalonyl-CoA/ethylmalonyl-CoA epimerase